MVTVRRQGTQLRPVEVCVVLTWTQAPGGTSTHPGGTLPRSGEQRGGGETPSHGSCFLLRVGPPEAAGQPASAHVPPGHGRGRSSLVKTHSPSSLRRPGLARPCCEVGGVSRGGARAAALCLQVPLTPRARLKACACACGSLGPDASAPAPRRPPSQARKRIRPLTLIPKHPVVSY